jgi:hypothetical protein
MEPAGAGLCEDPGVDKDQMVAYDTLAAYFV